jgi:hypothetical protein
MSLDIYQKEIIDIFQADTVIICSREVFSDVYSKGIEIHIYNPVTKILDFKTLPEPPANSYFQWLDGHEQIMDSLKVEGLPIVQRIMESCDMSKYDILSVWFEKKDMNWKQGYCYIFYYDFNK